MPMKNLTSAVLAAFILFGGVTLASARDDDNDDAKARAALQNAKVTLSQAIAVAEEKVPGGKAIGAGFDIVNGAGSYVVEIDKDGIQTVFVDPETGNVLKVMTGEWGADDDDDSDED